jgi:magnesium-protoporphyrin O-methyltransferase
MLAGLLVALLFSVAGALVCRNGFASLRFGKWMGLKASTVDDKAIVTSYFNNEGFSRWNNIYSASKDVNSVQLDIRSGHQRTVDKVISWMSGYDSSRTTLCDAGCGVGSLSIPASKLFKRVYASDISDAMVKEASKRAKDVGCKNIDFQVSDMEKLTGRYGTVACIDVMIHYPTEQVCIVPDAHFTPIW